MQARIELLRQVVGRGHPPGHKDSHNSNLPAIGEVAESASLERWRHVVVQGGEAVESALEGERRSLVAFLVE